MNTLHADLIAFRDAIGSDNFDATPPPSFMDAYAEAGTRYVQQCTDKIMLAHELPAEIERLVYHCVYLANSRESERKEADHDAQMKADGWIKIDWKSWADIPTEGAAELYLDNSSELFGGVKSVVCRLRKKTTKHGDHAFFLPPRSRSRGYDAARLAMGKSYYRLTSRNRTP